MNSWWMRSGIVYWIFACPVLGTIRFFSIFSYHRWLEICSVKPSFWPWWQGLNNWNWFNWFRLLNKLISSKAWIRVQADHSKDGEDSGYCIHSEFCKHFLDWMEHDFGLPWLASYLSSYTTTPSSFSHVLLLLWIE